MDPGEKLVALCFQIQDFRHVERWALSGRQGQIRDGNEGVEGSSQCDQSY